MTGVLAPIVLLGVIIAVHEFGHFLMAKCFGVKVEIFSIGFGSSLAQFRWGETEYRLAWIPFGGYVKLLGQEPGGEHIEPADVGRSLPDKAPWIRILIYVAGPAMNLLLPFVLLTPYVALSDDFAQVPGNAVGAVDQNMPAYLSGMREGDTIHKINGETVNSFWQIKDKVSAYHPDDGPLSIEVSRGLEQSMHQFDVTPKSVQRTHPILGYTDTRYLVGYQPAFLSAEVAILNPGGNLGRAGVKTFDRVISIDGRETPRYIDIIQRLKRTGPHQLVIERLEQPVDAGYPSIVRKNRFELRVEGSANIDELGIAHAGTCVVSVTPDGPASDLLRPGDCLTGVDGVNQSLGGFLVSRLLDRRSEAKSITWIRDGLKMEGELRQRFKTITDPLAGDMDIWLLGFALPRQTMVPLEHVTNQDRWTHGWNESVVQVSREVETSLRTLGGLFTGKVSTSQLGGPVTIMYLASSQAEAGLGPFIQFMVLVSVFIGVLNLLPIPLFDGGHIMVASLEWITRRPLPEKVQMALQTVGLVLVLSLIILALSNDAVRTWRLTNG